MNSAQLKVVLLALLTVVSLSIAAATIQTSVTTPGSGGEGGSGSANATGEQPPRFQVDVNVPVFGLEAEEATRNKSGGNATAEPVDESGNAGGGGSELLSPNVPTAIFVLLAVVLIIGAVVVLRNRDGDSAESDESNEPKPEPDQREATANVGQAAGKAATRITDTDATPENAIYNAWYDMTQHLEIANPATTTPGQFASAARDAGMRPSDVTELTAQFESVRYGGASLSDDRIDRAVSALRRIEDEYTERSEIEGTEEATAGDDGS